MNAKASFRATGPKNIAVVGAGHVGLVTAACFAEIGHDVICMDIDEARVEALRRGETPFYEPRLTDLVLENMSAGRLRFTTEYESAVENADFVFVAVATPTTPLGAPNLQFVRTAVRGIARAAHGRRPILVSKSTAPVAITDTLERILTEESNGAGPLPLVANPEFLREGTAVQDFLCPDRVVLGSADLQARERVGQLYAGLNCPILYTDIKTAEMVKYASNAFLATKISFINEMAGICEKVGADIRDVARGMGMDPRIGPDFLSAGIGFGGSCLPKDVRALAQLAALYGSHPQLLTDVLEINVEQRRHIVARLRTVLGKLRGARIAILGLAFKPGTDDIREAPAHDLIRLLEFEEVQLIGCDPIAIDNTRAVFPNIDYETDPYMAARDCDALIIATEWPEFRALDLEMLRKTMRTPVIADGRNVLDPEQARAAGFLYFGIGVSEQAVEASELVAV
jgi:UDPglucose 6-dehydrogenase